MINGHDALGQQYRSHPSDAVVIAELAGAECTIRVSLSAVSSIFDCGQGCCAMIPTWRTKRQKSIKGWLQSLAASLPRKADARPASGLWISHDIAEPVVEPIHPRPCLAFRLRPCIMAK